MLWWRDIVQIFLGLEWNRPRKEVSAIGLKLGWKPVSKSELSNQLALQILIAVREELKSKLLGIQSK